MKLSVFKYLSQREGVIEQKFIALFPTLTASGNGTQALEPGQVSNSSAYHAVFSSAPPFNSEL